MNMCIRGKQIKLDESCYIMLHYATSCYISILIYISYYFAFFKEDHSSCIRVIFLIRIFTFARLLSNYLT